ncbi:hypothetical protein OIE66_38105 [Nonomuraea sp. NBC_01738]|uniref:hypothetical protein n=1 Tax=Nonomuraea sp. NBC_01738 TaxID=2976003 RepID=UPI002E0D831C|nr:hypothetical protein OIE66_38105 [Nonomuraea sp. NBC_01738]
MIKKLVAICAGVLVGAAMLIGGSGAAQADSYECNPSKPNWVCSATTGSGQTEAWICRRSCESGENIVAGVRYTDEGDVVEVFDNGGKAPVAYVKVAGSGTAVFYGEGKHKQNYTEGKKIWVKVCSSSSSNRACTDFSPAGRT